MALQQSATGGRQRVLGGLPLRSAAVAGVVSFILGYIVTFVVEIGDVAEVLQHPLVDLSNVSTPADWQVIGWIFLAGHNAIVTIVATVGGTTTTSGLAIDVPTWLLLLPVGLLFVAGFAVVRYEDVRSPARGGTAGAAVAISYVVCVALLAVLSAWTVSQGGDASLRIAPDLLPALAIAGVGYPLVFGGVGGAFGAVLNE